MSKPTIKSDQFRELEAFRKKDLAVRKALAKRQERLDASQNAPRVVEQAIGGTTVIREAESRVERMRLFAPAMVITMAATFGVGRPPARSFQITKSSAGLESILSVSLTDRQWTIEELLTTPI